MTPPHISVYIHFPWCLRKCPYCDFHSLAADKIHIPHEIYTKAVIDELRWRREPIAESTLESVYFGGGTPSLWQTEHLGAVLQEILCSFRRATDAVEVTVECNPSSLDRAKAAALADQGVNRLSIGVQSLDRARLSFLERLHDPDSALQAIADAQAEVERVSADLIYALPGQSAIDAVREVQQLASLGLSHLSAYALTVEPGTRFGLLREQGRLEVASEEIFSESFGAIHCALEAGGFEHYEVSNYAKAGHRSLHNQRYWRGEPYLGLGADAVGCLPTGPGHARRYRNQSDPLQYIESSATPAVETFQEPLGPDELTREALMLALRTHDGLHLQALQQRTGIDPLRDRRRAIERAVDERNLVIDAGWLKVPKDRWLYLDRIIRDLF